MLHCSDYSHHSVSYMDKRKKNEGAVTYAASGVHPLGLNRKYIRTQWLTMHEYTEQNFGLLLPM